MNKIIGDLFVRGKLRMSKGPNDENGVDVFQMMVDSIYPVGSIYMSCNSTSPTTLFGGTWERITGQFLLGADDSTYIAGKAGGEATHKLTTKEMPKHTHIFERPKWYGTDVKSRDNAAAILTPSSTSGSYAYKPTTDIPEGIPAYQGESAAHNNMPPYLPVYMWKRTA